MRGVFSTTMIMAMLATLVVGTVQEAAADEALLERARAQAADDPHAAMAAYRAFLLQEPTHREAYVALVTLARQHGLSDPEGLLEDLAEEFASGTHLRTTQHFLLVYDMPHAWADTRARLLEQLHNAFYRQMAAAGFQPWPLHERLVCVLFADHEDYLAYAEQIGAGGIEGSGGFYTAALNRVVFFSFRSSPELREQGVQLERLRRQVNQLEQQLAEAQSRGDRSRAQNISNQRVRALRTLSRIENQYNAAIGRGDIAQTFHEAAHLLAFNSGIQVRQRPYPVWVSEGLATSFETVNPAGVFGPQHDNPGRRRALREAAGAGQLLPLEQLVGLRNMRELPQEQRVALYAQVWGLFHYLWNHRLDELRRYMQGLASGRYSAAEPDRAREDFEAVFGPVEELEQAWRGWVRTLPR